MMQVWCYDTNDFFTKSILTNKKEDNMTDIPLIKSFYKAKLVNNQWIEGATEEEIKEWEETNKQKPKELSENDLLKIELAQNTKDLAEKDFKIEQLQKDMADITKQLAIGGNIYNGLV